MISGCNTEGDPFVRYEWGDNKCQFTPEDAREHALHLIHCSEAAESDASVYKFFRERLEASKEQAAHVIGDLRNFRVGMENDE